MLAAALVRNRIISLTIRFSVTGIDGSASAIKRCAAIRQLSSTLTMYHIADVSELPL